MKNKLLLATSAFVITTFSALGAASDTHITASAARAYFQQLERESSGVKKLPPKPATSSSSSSSSVSSRPLPPKPEGEYVRLINFIKSNDYISHIDTEAQGREKIKNRLKKEICAHSIANSTDKLIINPYFPSRNFYDTEPRWIEILATPEGVQESDMPYVGWKIHVSSDLKHSIDVAKIVIPYLLHNNITCKIATTGLIEKNAKNLTQNGKFITIYPQSNEDTIKIGRELNILIAQHNLSKIKVPVVICDISLSNQIYTRYGALKAGNYSRYYDNRYFPFPESIWTSEDNIFAGSSAKWTFPGTTRDIPLDGREINSWTQVINPEYILPYVKRDEASFEAFISSYYELCDHLRQEISPECDKYLQTHFSVYYKNFLEKKASISTLGRGY